MPATLVPTVRTTYTNTQLVQGFIEGWKGLYDSYPKKESIAVIWAQNAIETGGTAAMWNNNIGNVKFVANKDGSLDDGKKYMMLANTWEIVNGKKVIFQPPHPATWFRAFDSLAEGITFHFGFLRNQRYKSSWKAVEAGDPAQFAHLLKVAGYYTAPEETYVAAVKAYFNKFMKDKTFETVLATLQAPPAPEPEPIPEPTPEPPAPEPVPVPEPVPTPPPPAPKKSTLETVVDIFFPLLNLFKKKN